MARRAAGRFIGWFRPVRGDDRGRGGQSLQEQLYGAIRRAVLGGELAPGERLPSSRALAADLGLGRNTVIVAMERLVAEGYLESRRGAGLFVTTDLPPELAAGSGPAASSRAEPVLSRRSGRFAPLHAEGEQAAARPFATGSLALDEFPLDLWRRLAGQTLRREGRQLLAYGPAQGLPALRRMLAGYLAETRGVVCSPDTIVVVSGAQQALDLIGRLLLDPGDAVAVEDPGYVGAREALAGIGARLQPVAVDAQGFDPAVLARLQPAPKLVMLTPSHQFPLGMTLPLSRRLALLAEARARNLWIVEDDYDCEFRYSGPPLQALQGLDGGERVLYVGTFSKVLFPGLRLGYVVLPAPLVEGFLRLKATADGFAPPAAQATLAAFIAEGHLVQHVRRMRVLYRRRRAALLQALQQHAADLVEICASEAGLHLAVTFRDGRDDRLAAAAARAAGLSVSPLSRYAIARPASGLVLGFAGFPETELVAAVQRLASVLR
jgi:GntR family transcriptional regulator/MocR family aminotransferase